MKGMHLQNSCSPTDGSLLVISKVLTQQLDELVAKLIHLEELWKGVKLAQHHGVEWVWSVGLVGGVSRRLSLLLVVSEVGASG